MRFFQPLLVIGIIGNIGGFIACLLFVLSRFADRMEPPRAPQRIRVLAMALVGYTFVLLLTVILSQFEVIDSFARVDRNPMGMTFMALGVILLFSAFGLMIVYLVRLEGTLRIARQIRAAMKAVGIEDVRALLEESALPQRGASEQK